MVSRNGVGRLYGAALSVGTRGRRNAGTTERGDSPHKRIFIALQLLVRQPPMVATFPILNNVNRQVIPPIIMGWNVANQNST